MEAFENLGRRVEKAWRAVDFAEAAFPAIAAEALESAAIPNSVGPDAILRWALETLGPPTQIDPQAKFGQPPITLHAGRRFQIDALFWVDGTPAVHQHKFSGAFQVLSGSSIHGRFAFETERRVSDAFLVGRLTHRSSDLLKTGDVVPIESGDRFVHSTFHLDRPSVSLVVRTRHDPLAPPQYHYWKPHFAIDPYFDDPWTRRLVQIVAFLEAVSHPDYESMVGGLVARADAYTCFQVLHAALTLPDRALFGRLLERARERHGDLVERMATVFESARRDTLIRAKRAYVHAPDHRFFLAALLNASTASQIQLLVSAYRPASHPADTIAGWIGELAAVTLKLRVAGQPWEPNVLGIPACDAGCLDALKRALRGEKTPPGGKAAAFLDGLRGSTIFGPLFA